MTTESTPTSLFEFACAILNSTSMEEKVSLTNLAVEFFMENDQFPIITNEQLKTITNQRGKKNIEQIIEAKNDLEQDNNKTVEKSNSINVLKEGQCNKCNSCDDECIQSDHNSIQVPDYPGRPKDLIIVAPGRVKRRGTGSLEGKQAFVHSICHMESYAIDISWDIIARYILFKEDEFIGQSSQKLESNEPTSFNEINDIQSSILPREFFEDWLIVAADEAKHFGWLSKRLKELGSFYGGLPVHEGLWESCYTTRNSLLARLCILHCVHEARGLDIVPNRVKQLEDSKDFETCILFKNIVKEEVDHVRKGVKWFQYLCEQVYQVDTEPTFHKIVSQYFKGNLKPPFNEELRCEAGMPKEWYLKSEMKE